jgi:hypothetical protein
MAQTNKDYGFHKVALKVMSVALVVQLTDTCARWLIRMSHQSHLLSGLPVILVPVLTSIYFIRSKHSKLSSAYPGNRFYTVLGDDLSKMFVIFFVDIAAWIILSW